MDVGGPNSRGSESLQSDEPVPPGIIDEEFQKVATPKLDLKPSNSSPTFSTKPTAKGVANAKKRLRAFSIQKKSPLPSVPVPKPVTTGNTTVLIGRLSSVKITPKPEKVDDEQKKIPRPPKPGGSKKNYMESYSELQKRTLSEIEDMKRKMELVELGIPLGLISPSTNEKAMPTKAMPPIKTFLDSAKVDEIIREAKKCRAEGREFKFDYQKLLPDYDNPFQRTKRDEQLQQLLQQQQQQEQHEQHQPQTPIQDKLEDKFEDIELKIKDREKDKRRSDKYDRKYSFRRDDRYKEKDRSRDRDRSRDTDDKIKKEKKDRVENLRRDAKETKVDLSDYLVCDSWSLDEKNSSPYVDEKLDLANIPMPKEVKAKEQTDRLKEIISNKEVMDSPKEKPIKIERLQPVIDSFEFEIDPNEDDEVIFDGETNAEKHAKPTTHPKRDSPLFDSKMPQDNDMNDDMFLESVLNEIKQENLSEDENEKGLVEYDMSPDRDNLDYSKSEERVSVTPELDERVLQSQRSDYSDTRSTDSSGIKSTESGYRSQSSRRSSRLSAEKVFEPELEDKLAGSTVDSLETWSFVLKICQPLLFRHDRNRCFKETRSMPKVWYSMSPKVCSCVKGRAVVYEELEMCKSGLVDRVYQCPQFPELPITKTRNWYTPLPYCLMETPSIPTTNEWEDIHETETYTTKQAYKDSLNERTENKPDRTESEYDRKETKKEKKESKADGSRTENKKSKSKKSQRLSMTPERREEVSLDIEYQRFMEAVCFDVSEPKQEAARSTTPVRQEPKKKKKKKNSEPEKKKEVEKNQVEGEKRKTEDGTEKKKVKSNESKSSEGWSQESLDDDEEKRQDNKRKKKLEAEESEKKAAAEAAKKQKMCADNWSQESDLEEQEVEKSKREKLKVKKTRKRKHSTSTISSSDSEDLKKKRKALKKKLKNTKSKSAKRRKLGKKILKKLKEKKIKKKEESEPEEEENAGEDVEIINDEVNEEPKKKDKKLKKKKRLKLKKKTEKKKKKVKSSSSSSSESSSESESESEKSAKKKKTEDSQKKKKKKKKTRQSSTESSTSQSEDLFDVNVLKNIKTERLLDDEPQQRSHREIISVQQLQDDFSSNVKIKQEVEDAKPETEAELDNTFSLNEQNETPVVTPTEVEVAVGLKEPQPQKPDDTNHSQSSQDSVVSVKEPPPYEKDESHLRPSSQTSDYSFRDVMAGEPDQYKSADSNQYKTTEEDKYPAYEESYEMYEHMAMAYQSDVASKQHALDTANEGEQRIETVVCNRSRGEIKCDWRRTDPPAQPAQNRPSRWGLKPGEVNIVLTGGNDTSNNEQYPIQSIPEPVYKIQSLANRNDTTQPSCYDEAYMDMYGAMDRLQYGDCFAPPSSATQTRAALTPTTATSANTVVPVRNTLDDRIDRALRETVLGEVAKDTSGGEKESSDKGILVTKSLEGRAGKRVTFADGYKPGQDSDTEEPPVKKRKKPKRVGCAWPCPATHPDHVPLWDALPPPPPPPGSPPPPAHAAPPIHLLRARQMGVQHMTENTLTALPYPMQKFDVSAPVPNFMPPEPPPGLINFT